MKETCELHIQYVAGNPALHATIAKIEEMADKHKCDPRPGDTTKGIPLIISGPEKNSKKLQKDLKENHLPSGFFPHPS